MNCLNDTTLNGRGSVNIALASNINFARHVKNKYKGAVEQMPPPKSKGKGSASGQGAKDWACGQGAQGAKGRSYSQGAQGAEYTRRQWNIGDNDWKTRRRYRSASNWFHQRVAPEYFRNDYPIFSIGLVALN